MAEFLQQFQELTGQLQALGYHQFQIRQIIRDGMGTAELDRLTPEQQQALLRDLNDYVKFAMKCKAVQRAK